MLASAQPAAATAMASSSATPACGWEIGLGFTEAELAAADQLVQLSGSGGGDAAWPSSSCSSPRSVNTCAGAAAWEEEEMSIARLGEELDMRARKRYRLLSDLYAATGPATGATAAVSSAKKRKRRVEPDALEAATARYGDQSF